MSILAKAVLGVLPRVPKPVLRIFARNYIAGETLPEALAKLEQLARQGYPGILDILGEDVTSEQGSRAVVEQYAQAAAAIARSEEHTSELQSQSNLVCRLLLEKKKKQAH